MSRPTGPSRRAAVWRSRPFRAAAGLLVVAAALAACGPDEGDPPERSGGAAPAADAGPPHGAPRSPRAAAALDTAWLAGFAERGDAGAEASRGAARRLVAAGPDAARVLVEGLAARDPEIAAGAIEGAAIVPAVALDPLIAALDSDDDVLRANAARALLETRDWWAVRGDAARISDRTTRGLARSLGPERLHRLRLIAATGRVPGADLRPVGALLPMAEGDELAAVAEILGAAGSEARSWAGELRARLDAPPPPSDRARGELEIAIAAVGPEDAQVAIELASGLDGASEEREEQVLRRLGSWGADAAPALGVLVARLPPAGKWAPDRLLDALASIPGGELAAVRAWVEWAAAERESDPWWGARWWEATGSRSAVVLAWLRDVAANGDAAHRAAAIRALAGAPEPSRAEAASVALGALTDPDAHVRRSTRWAWRFAVGGAVAPAMQAISDADAEIRRSGVSALGEAFAGTRNSEVAQRVAALLDDPDDDVRFHAGNALEEIGTAPAESLGSIRRNLASPTRAVRLGAVRAARALGPAARAATPELLAMIGDGDLDDLAVAALGAMGEPDSEIRSRVRAWVEREPGRAARVSRDFGEAGGFLEDLVPVADRAEGRARELLAPQWGGGREAALWGRLESDTWGGLRALDASTVHALQEIARGPVPGDACRSLHLLAAAEATRSLDVFVACVRSDSSRIRAAAAFGLVAAAGAGADVPADATDRARVGPTEDAAERAAWFHLLAACGRVGGNAADAARAAVADATQPVPVRIAAADVVAAAGDAGTALRVLREELLVPAGSFGWMSPPGLTEDVLNPPQRAWCRAAHVVRRLGPAAAPIADDVAWAAVRAGHTLARLRLVEALAAIGPAAAGSADLLRRVPPGHWVRDPWTEELDAARKRADAALGAGAGGPR